MNKRNKKSIVILKSNKPVLNSHLKIKHEYQERSSTKIILINRAPQVQKAVRRNVINPQSLCNLLSLEGKRMIKAINAIESVICTYIFDLFELGLKNCYLSDQVNSFVIV